METSDSEAFESADEDFCSDDETQIEQHRGAKKDGHSELLEKAKKLSISDELGKKCETSESNTKMTAKDKCMKDERNIEEIIEKKDDSVTVSGGDLTCYAPPVRQECWEPGMDYEICPSEKTSAKKSLDNLKKDDDRNRSIILPQQQREDDSKRQIPPPGSSSGFNKQTVIPIKRADSENKPKRPEFGIPPARTTCWVPGVNNVQQPFEPHPAYLELMKKKNSNNETTSKEADSDFEDIKKAKGDATKTLEESELICQNVSTITDEGKTKHEDPKENMWENEDDWADFDTPSNSNVQISKPIAKKIDSIKESTETESNMWEDDDWEPLAPETVEQCQNQVNEQEKLSWSGWGSWGLTSVINTATTLTSHVSQGITNVLETGIGAPDPVELARINKLENEKMKLLNTEANQETQAEKPILSFGLGNLMQGVSKLVETTGTKVISGGLDTLETIGKKTMEVLQENDPGLKKKRAFLKLDDDKPILSQVLRDAKEKAEKENKELETKHFARRANYETLFDDHQGLVHLEALEMLSKQCDIKLESLLGSTTGEALNDMQETLDQVKELCELPEEDEDENLSTEEIQERLESAVSEINIKITYKRLVSTWKEVEDWLVKLNLNICNKNELHQQAIESLAQLTAIAVEQFHKAGELLLIKDHRSTADEADSLVQLTTTLTMLIGIVAARFSDKLNMTVSGSSEKEEVNGLITNVFFEAANSSSYIQDAFQLLIPVLQVGAV